MANLNKTQQTELLATLGLDAGTPFEDVMAAAVDLKNKASRRPRRARGVISADEHGRISISGLGCTFWRDDFEDITSAFALVPAFIAEDASSDNPKLLDGEVGRKKRSAAVKQKKAENDAKKAAEAASQ